MAADGYAADVEMGSGAMLPMVTSPVRFDGRPARPTRAPGHTGHTGHTEEVLLELGLSWDEVAALKDRRAIL